MSGNTSATGGYVLPSAAPVTSEDDDLVNALHTVITGCAGIDPTLVRPRWQPRPPTQPHPEATWCAFGIARRTADFNAVVVHDPIGPDGRGQDKLQTYETIELALSFYGPRCNGAATMFRDGLQIGQNREGLHAINAGLIEVQDVIAMPELVNEQWINRADCTVRLRRMVLRDYPIFNLVSAGGLIEPAGRTPGTLGDARAWDVEPPPDAQ